MRIPKKTRKEDKEKTFPTFLWEFMEGFEDIKKEFEDEKARRYNKR